MRGFIRLSKDMKINTFSFSNYEMGDEYESSIDMIWFYNTIDDLIFDSDILKKECTDRIFEVEILGEVHPPISKEYTMGKYKTNKIRFNREINRTQILSLCM